MNISYRIGTGLFLAMNIGWSSAATAGPISNFIQAAVAVLRKRAVIAASATVAVPLVGSTVITPKEKLPDGIYTGIGTIEIETQEDPLNNPRSTHMTVAGVNNKIITTSLKRVPTFGPLSTGEELSNQKDRNPTPLFKVSSGKRCVYIELLTDKEEIVIYPRPNDLRIVATLIDQREQAVPINTMQRELIELSDLISPYVVKLHRPSWWSRFFWQKKGASVKVFDSRSAEKASNSGLPHSEGR